MQSQEEIRRGRHVVSKLHCHLVFVTKYRKGAITERVFQSLLESWKRTADSMALVLVETNFEEDHVHLHIEYPASQSVSKIVNALKGASSFYLRQANFPEVRSCLWGRHFWSPSYFASSCGGASLEVLAQYISNQRGDSSPA